MGIHDVRFSIGKESESGVGVKGVKRRRSRMGG